MTEEKIKSHESSDDIKIDVNNITAFAKKYSTLILLIAIVIAQFMPNYGFLPWGGLWMRMQTQNLPMLDDLAKNAVENFFKNQIINSIQQNQDFKGQDPNQFLEEQWQKILKENKQQVEEQIKQTAVYLKDTEQYEENGIKYTMMPDIDPYQYLRLARNYLTYGALGDTTKNEESLDSKVIAPIGVDAKAYNELQPYILAYIYKIAKVFKPQIPLMQAAAYFPIIFVTLAVIFAFLLGRKITNNTGGLFTATIISISSAGVGRTQWGHADTDAYNLFFPMLISWLFAETIQAQTVRKKMLFSLTNAFVIGLYAFAWVGWWYLFDFLIAALLVQLIYVILFNSAQIKQTAITIITYFFGSFMFYFVFKRELTSFFVSMLSPLNFNLIRSAAHADVYDNLFPNVYTTVAELNPTTITGAINSIGGEIFLIMGIIGKFLRQLSLSHQ